MHWITHLLALINALLAKIHDSDRVFWILVRRLLSRWRDTLLIVKPETVINWHRKGWRYYWRRKSQRGRPGRPKIDPEVIELIRRMSRDNATWGAPRIQSELALLGHEIAESTVAKYMVRHPKEPSQTWRTFLVNHMSVAAACDFFVVPTLTFKPLYYFVVLSHDRRKTVHVNVTRHPTDEWTAQQIVEAFPGDGCEPRYLHRDRDSVYGRMFRKKITAIGIAEVISARKSPWQNPFAERVIGYNESRTHLSLEGNSPIPRQVEDGPGEVIAIPHLGGLHHRYSRAA